MDRFHTMQLFTRVVELGSFTRAASQLDITRSAATQGIQQLEARLGVRLLLRTTRQVTATADGQAYYQRCRAILADVEDAEADFLHTRHQPQGRIRVDLSGSLCRRVLVPALPAFCERYPRIQLDISVRDRPIDLVREGVDCVLRIGALGDVPLVARPLGELHQVTCASPAYIARYGHPHTVADLSTPEAEHRTVGYISASRGRSLLLQFNVEGRLETLELPASVNVNNGDVYVAAGVAGLGLVQMSHYLAAAALASGALVEVLAPYRPPPLPLHVLYPPRHPLPARLRVFIDWLAQCFTPAPEAPTAPEV